MMDTTGRSSFLVRTRFNPMNLTIKIIWTVIRTALSLALLSISVLAFIETYTATTKEKRAILPVAATVPVSDGHGLSKSYPVVELEGPNKTTRSLSVSGLFLGEEYAEGSYILVRYNPEVPTSVRVDSLPSNAMRWAFPVGTGLLGLLVLPTIKQFKKDLKKDGSKTT
jgi:hypothetical protein